MNSRLHIPRKRPRHNPQFMIDAARWMVKQRRRVTELRRLLRTGLHFRAAIWCAWNIK